MVTHCKFSAVSFVVLCSERVISVAKSRFDLTVQALQNYSEACLEVQGKKSLISITDLNASDFLSIVFP